MHSTPPGILPAKRFARGTEEAHTAINQFDKGSLKSIDADRPPSCPVADKQDDTVTDGRMGGDRQY
ncbi:MAG: hypothetical protein ACJ705_09295 [Nitrososphaeraceae archaeon]